MATGLNERMRLARRAREIGPRGLAQRFLLKCLGALEKQDRSVEAPTAPAPREVELAVSPPALPIDQKQLVSDRWGETRTEALDWWQSVPAIERRTVRLFGGDEWRDPSAYFGVLDRYCDPARRFGRVLTLCCGHGAASVGIAQKYSVDSLLGLDLAPQAIQNARNLAASRGFDHLRFEVQDLNEPKLEGPFDLIVGEGIHHIDNLEALCAQIKNALAPGGVVCMWEYIGPNRCQPTSRQLEAINACIRLLPERYRVKRSALAALGARDGAHAIEILRGRLIASRPAPAPIVPTSSDSPKTFFERQMSYPAYDIYRSDLVSSYAEFESYFNVGFIPVTPGQWVVADPSEAVRSQDIIPCLRNAFKYVHVYPARGTVLQWVLYEIAHNFHGDTEEDREMIDMLVNIEDTLMKRDMVPENYAFIIASDTHAAKL
jgi:SAM-dependent methyltransferase